MIWFCHLYKKESFFIVLGVDHSDPICIQKIVIFTGFSDFFFRTTGLLKLLILIESCNIFHRKPECYVRNSLFGLFAIKMWVQLGSVAKKVVFIPATLLPTHFSLKAKFLTVIVS